MNSVFRHRWLSLILAFSIAMPSSIFAQAPDTSKTMTHEEAILLAEAHADEMRDFELNSQSLFNLLPSFVVSGLSFSLVFFLTKWIIRDPADGSLSFKDLPLLKMSELEITSDPVKFQQFMELTYLDENPKTKMQLKRFHNLNHLLDRFEKTQKFMIPSFVGSDEIESTPAEMFKYLLRASKKGKLSFMAQLPVQMLQCLAFSANPEKFLQSGIMMANVGVALQQHPPMSIIRAMMLSPGGEMFEPEYFANFGRYLLQIERSGRSDLANLVATVRANKIQGFNATLIDSHEEILDRRYEQAIRSVTKQRLFVSTGIALVLGVAAYLYFNSSQEKENQTVTDQYNITIPDLFRMIIEDPETYSAFLRQSKNFAIEMAMISKKYNETIRTAQQDLHVFNQLVETYKKSNANQ
jgi:hypothetical protein